jgi:predicted ABC-type transport system involved in lysophospholipase L1 biosynthesis ATPase subunit
MISGVSELTSGEVLFYSYGNDSTNRALPIHTLSEDKLAVWRGENIGIIYQSLN